MRIPIDPSLYRGDFCPNCGEPMERMVTGFENFSDCKADPHIKRTIDVVLDNIRSAYNVGSIFRTADAAGTRNIHCCGITPSPSGNEAIKKTALGAEMTVPWTYHTNALQVVQELQQEGALILALECTSQSIPLDAFAAYATNEPKDRPCVLVVGNEKSGVDPAILEMCDHTLSIPMRGSKQSLNVAVAFAVAVYWLAFR
jgi:tRNA G18 (ribose-2'-O)-methylase SpoU